MCDGSMEVLADIALTIIRSGSAEAAQALTQGLSIAGAYLQADYGYMLLYNPAAQARLISSWHAKSANNASPDGLPADASWWQQRLNGHAELVYPGPDAQASPSPELRQLVTVLGCRALTAAAWGEAGACQGAVVFTCAKTAPGWEGQPAGFVTALAQVLGAVAAVVQENQATASRRDQRLLDGITKVAGELLSTTAIESSISRALAELGHAAQVDRVYVFEDHVDPISGSACSTQTYEWTAAGISCQLDNPQTHNVPHDGPMHRIFEAFERDEAFSYIASKLTPDERSILDPQAIQSMLHVPIWVDGRLWGFLGVDDCHSEREFSESETASFRTVASMIGNAVARLRIKLALIESEERFRLAFDRSAAGMAISDPSMRLLRANLAFCTMVGYSAEELAQLGIAGITHPDDIAEDRANFAAVLAGEKNGFSRDKRFVHKNGSVIWTHLSAALLRDVNGAPSYLIGQVIDITERKQAERALQISEERFRHLAEDVADIIWTTDVQGRFTYCTPAISTILGYRPEEVLHQERQKLMHPDDIESAQAELQQLLARRRSYRRQEFKLLHKDGREVVLESSADPVFDRAGAFLGFHGIDRDITLVKQAQAERDRLIEELSRAVAEIETLHGLLPMCSGCKKIRGDDDTWTAIDQYISQRSDINFSHGLCPDCLRTLYPDLFSGINR